MELVRVEKEEKIKDLEDKMEVVEI